MILGGIKHYQRWYAKEGLRRPSRQPPRCWVSGSSNVSTRWGDERGNATGGINSAMYGRIKENSNTYIVKLTIKLIFKRRIARFEFKPA